MKVLDLCCGQGHGFEGWFASDDDFVGQHARGLIECPLCGDKGVTRRPSAPRLNLSGAREPAPPPTKPLPVQGGAPDPQKLVQAAWMKAVRHVMAHTEDVGERFPEEARRMHYGEIETRGIRGQASPDQRAALVEEGIEIATLALPKGLEGPLQ